MLNGVSVGPLTPGYGYVPVIVNSYLKRHLIQSKSTSLQATYWGLPQSIARILDPGNSRENQLDFFSLDHEK